MATFSSPLGSKLTWMTSESVCRLSTLRLDSVSRRDACSICSCAKLSACEREDIVDVDRLWDGETMIWDECSSMARASRAGGLEAERGCCCCCCCGCFARRLGGDMARAADCVADSMRCSMLMMSSTMAVGLAEIPPGEPGLASRLGELSGLALRARAGVDGDARPRCC